MTPFSLYARAFIAYCVHEYQLGHVTRIDVWLTPRSFTVGDDGRGMGLHREGYVTNLMGTICGAHGEVQLHGVGLSIVAASSPSLEVESRRDRKLWKQSFAW
ncbi:MAG: DNA topoisomerase IV subunit B, partial [Ramlibacter sp.]|nr:DNA topoisomerase IV subunit B [Ramlibacter sp.]